MKFFFEVSPIGAVRMTRRGKFVKPSAKRYLSFKSFIGMEINKQMALNGWIKMDKPVGVIVVFHMPIPKSLAKKVKEGDFHTKKPDIDNLQKSVFDAANGLIWVDDNRVVDIRALKIYSDKPGIELEVFELEG